MFYVGQRVRKVCGPNQGFEGCVVGHGNGQINTRRLVQNDISVIYATSWRSNTGYLFPASVTAYGVSDDYEPILPPDLESIEEINALYAPDPVEARA